MQNKNVKILNSLYQNTSMSVSSLEKIIPKIDDINLKSELQKQLDVYNKRNIKLKEQLYTLNSTPKDIDAYTKVVADMGIKMNTLFNKTPSHIAKMIIQGTNMGIIDINQTLNNNKCVEENIINEAKFILKGEQKYLDDMKKYL